VLKSYKAKALTSTDLSNIFIHSILGLILNCSLKCRQNNYICLTDEKLNLYKNEIT